MTTSPPYRAALFDWDGTLADTLDVWMRCYQWTLHGWGLNPPPQKIAAQFGDWRGVLGLGVREDSFEAFWQLMHSYLNRELPRAGLYPGALSTLQALRVEGVRTALVTTARPMNIDPALQSHGLRELFDAIVTGDDVTHHKPHPEPIELALHTLRIEPEHAVMVGDSDKDLCAAQAASVDAVFFHPPVHAAFYDAPALRTQFHPRWECADWDSIRGVLLPESSDAPGQQTDRETPSA